jgi:hypothetical protein
MSEQGKQMDANKYDKLSDDEKMEKLLTVFSDPDEAESHLYKKFVDLPPEAQSNMRDEETASVQGKWPAEWNALVDRVNQDSDIEAFESTGPAGGALSRLRNLKTREEFTVVIPRDAMYKGRAYAMYTPDYTRRTGSKPASGTTVSISQLIDFFNKSYNKIKENTMKLKNLLEQTRFGTKNITEQADSNIEQQIVTALYQVIADNQNAQTGIDVIDDMLERNTSAKTVANRDMMPIVKKLAPIIETLIEICDEIDYQG